MSFPILTAVDLIMGPFILLILFGIVYFQLKKYRNTPIAVYFLPAFWLRMLGAFLTACMYQYYYNGGDTFMYFRHSSSIVQVFLLDPSSGFELIFKDVDNLSHVAESYLSQINRGAVNSIHAESTGIVIRVAAFFHFLTFNSFLGTSFIMTTFAFWGCWRIFLVFYDLYPNLHKPLAIATLFIPSLFFWGTGIMKDSISIAGLGFLFHGSYYLFIKRKKIISSSITMFIGGWFAFTAKSYIIAAFAPPLLIWVFFVYKNKIKQRIIRILLGPILLLIGSVLTASLASKMIQSLGFDNLDEGIERSIITYEYIMDRSQRSGGTYYDLGTIEPTLSGMAKIFPKAVNVALFRPYLWEIGKVINIPAALESLITLFFTLYVFFNVGVFTAFRLIIKNPEILFCFIFSILFAFIVGLSSSNFGALARYKIPQLPFYFAGLILLLSYSKKLKPNSLMS